MTGKQQTAVVSIIAAAVLVGLKLGAGLAIGSLGLISAGLESSGDVVAAVLTFFAVRLAGRPPDERHRYGHARAENLAALGEAIVLAAGGTFVISQALQRLLSGGGQRLEVSWEVFVVLVVVVAVDASRALTSLRSARLYGSPALRSNAFHFGADLAGTTAVVVGLVLVWIGLESADAIAALFVSVLIFLAVGRLLSENIPSLMDAAPAGALNRARTALEALEDVELQRLRVREAAGRHFADVVVGIAGTAALAQGHAAADAVEEAIRAALPGSDVVVHVEPLEEHLPVDRVLAAAISVPGVREAHNVKVFELDDRREVSLHLKVSGQTRLAEGHRIAEAVAERIRARVPEVDAVQTHLEPFEPIAVRARSPATADVSHAERRIVEIVQAITSTTPRNVHFLESPNGLLVMLTLALEESLLVEEAHRLASEVESAVHAELPAVSELVIHTEP